MERNTIAIGPSESFAREDVLSQSQRVIDIILRNSNFSSSAEIRLLGLQKAVLTNSRIDPIKAGPGTHHWHELLKLSKERQWFDTYHHGLVISYFHRLVLDKLGYFESLVDPYGSIKREMLRSFLPNLTKDPSKFQIEDILMKMLWGNKVDLVPPHIGEGKVFLEDQRNQFVEYLFKTSLRRVDILADNAGEELFWDLVFVDYLLKMTTTKEIIYHVKNYPYNISDTTEEDFNHAISCLVKSSASYLSFLGERLTQYLKRGSLSVVSYPFTTLGVNRIQAMNVVRKRYQPSSLIVTKGDFNYRKNVGWYYWQPGADYDEIVSYLGAPLLCFRAIKNEVIVGVQNINAVKGLEETDPSWWKKGIGGVILFSLPKDSSYTSARINDYWATGYE